MKKLYGILKSALLCTIGACLLLSSCAAAPENYGLYAGDVQEADVFRQQLYLSPYGSPAHEGELSADF